MERASIFLFTDTNQYLIHSISTLSMGGGIASPPYFWLDVNSTDEELIQRLIYVLNCSKTGLPRPADWNASNKEYLDSIGLKKNKDLYTNSLLVEIFKKDDLIEFSSTVNMGRKGYINKVPDFKITLPASSGSEELAKALKKAFSECE